MGRHFSQQAVHVRHHIHEVLRLSWSFVRRRPAIATTLALTLVVGTVSAFAFRPSPESEDELLLDVEFADDGKLTVGTVSDQPFVSYKDNKGKRDGFDVEIALAFGRKHGFHEADVVFRDVDVEERERVLESEEVDLVVSSYSITDTRKKRILFAGPYLFTSQEALVPREVALATEGEIDIRQKRVCTTGGSTAEDTLKAQGYANVFGSRTNQWCIDGLLADKYDAFITDRAILAGFKHKYFPKFDIKDLAITEAERWGIGVGRHNEPLRRLVDDFLWESREEGQDGPWQSSYNRTLGVLQDMPAEVEQPRPDIPEDIQAAGDVTRGRSRLGAQNQARCLIPVAPGSPATSSGP